MFCLSVFCILRGRQQLANPVAEDFNRKNPLNYAKRDFEKSWYHTRTAKTISLDEITENADNGAEISDVVDIEEVIAAISAEEFLNTLDETEKNCRYACKEVSAS